MKLSGKKYQRLWRNIGLILLEAFLCLSLVLTGSLFWVNNTCAVIPDNDPTTMIEMSQLLGGCLNYMPAERLIRMTMAYIHCWQISASNQLQFSDGEMILKDVY